MENIFVLLLYYIQGHYFKLQANQCLHLQGRRESDLTLLDQSVYRWVSLSRFGPTQRK